MSENERDIGAEGAAPPPDDAAPPRTWAGRSRAGGEQPGMTEDFDIVEAELSSELGGEEPEEEAGGSDVDPADEREAPPDEFEFAEEGDEPGGEQDDEEADGGEAQSAGDEAEAGEAQSTGDEEEAGAGEAEPEGDEGEAGASPRDTAEFDTLAAAEAEAAREAAHAGLAARTAAHSAKRGIPAAPSRPPPSAVAPPDVGEPPRTRLWLRFLAAALVIVASMAMATSVSAIVFLDDVADKINRIEAKGLADVEGGDPQTILILGSDKRSGTPGDRGRSDTTMLLRVDPDREAIALFSLPRDLKVNVPGLGTEKLNEAYSYGGPQLTLDTVRKLLGIDINVLVNVDFSGFYDAVNAIDCVYIDVDRHYYVPPESGFDDIDIEAGYTKLCGYRALDYVRYRHNDNDLVRAARQQDFVREARQRIPPRVLWNKRTQFLDIFTRYTDATIKSGTELLQLLMTFVDARNATVQEIHFNGAFAGDYVVATKDQLKAAVDQFLGTEDTPGSRTGKGGGSKGKQKQEKRRKRPMPKPEDVPMIDVAGAASQYAQSFDSYMKQKKTRLPIVFPTRLVPSAATGVHSESRAFPVPGPGDEKIYRGYKFVAPYADEGFTSYYGVSGVSWTNPPILENPSETRTINGREYLLFYDGDRLRLVGWKTGKGSYWVINTLTQALSEEQMLAIATTVDRY